MLLTSDHDSDLSLAARANSKMAELEERGVHVHPADIQPSAKGFWWWLLLPAEPTRSQMRIVIV